MPHGSNSFDLKAFQCCGKSTATNSAPSGDMFAAARSCCKALAYKAPSFTSCRAGFTSLTTLHKCALESKAVSCGVTSTGRVGGLSSNQPAWTLTAFVLS